MDHLQRVNGPFAKSKWSIYHVNLAFIKKLKIYFVLVPFEEDERNPDIWYLDHSYLESMHSMYRKVNGKQKYSRSYIFLVFQIIV